ncbi:putative exoribonuclease II [Forsythia ovata]|uniref:Cyclin-dependent kinases regulatory subunit n=1 Tax=Forsythia ovata TaxID=205694 RepID=A0ABD1TUK5_9LAMI
MTSIKPQQITFIVPGVENFDHTEILDFVQRAQSNLDLLLEFAWIELLEKNKSVRVEELAEVDELLRMKHAKEAAEKELKEFVKLLKPAREMPSHSKPTKSSWRTEEKIQHRIEFCTTGLPSYVKIKVDDMTFHQKWLNYFPRIVFSENEWCAIGVQQIRGWIHYALHHPEPHIMLFRRLLNYQQQQKNQALKNRPRSKKMKAYRKTSRGLFLPKNS